MELRGKRVALYGRFTAGARVRLAGEVARLGGHVERDFESGCHVFVVGALARALIDTGALAPRLAAAAARGAPILGERGFAGALAAHDPAGEATAPLAAVIAPLALPAEAPLVLAAFDIVRIENGACRFGDAAALRAASDLLAAGRSLGETVRILQEASDRAPRGRRRIVTGPDGRALLQWEDGRTTLDGQGYLPLDEGGATLAQLFEAAAAAEAEGDIAEAARLYELSARADRKDPVACFNLGNVKLAAGDAAQAVLAFQLALARDPAFAAARYNLAEAYEHLGALDLARDELTRALALAPHYADARFNLARLELKRGALAAAKAHYELYLKTDPPADWAAKARKAIQFCTAQLGAAS